MSQASLFYPPVLTITELTRYLRALLEEDEVLQDVWVQGEVSNFSRPSSGHLYFTLKDEGAALRCVMWRNTALRQSFLPRDGDAVEAHGTVSVYEAGGQYQLYVDLLRPAGEGALYQEFLRLKSRLEAEGLFEAERKRPIPAWPRRIGIVTSPSGAALRDMLNTLRRRYPLAEVILAPTAVQGEEAPEGIVAALESLARAARPDVILVARGGGSIEDLWAFNDERVAYAIAACPAPVITGIGHETDFTIADFVADLRAPTPTAAAELATPNQADLRLGLEELGERLRRAAESLLTARRWELSEAKGRLNACSPRHRLQSDRQRVDELTRRAATATKHRLGLDYAHLQGLRQRLGALNPLSVLERGFAILSTPQGQVVHSVRQTFAGQLLQARLSDGTLGVKVESPESSTSLEKAERR